MQLIPNNAHSKRLNEERMKAEIIKHEYNWGNEKINEISISSILHLTVSPPSPLSLYLSLFLSLLLSISTLFTLIINSESHLCLHCVCALGCLPSSRVNFISHFSHNFLLLFHNLFQFIANICRTSKAKKKTFAQFSLTWTLIKITPCCLLLLVKLSSSSRVQVEASSKSISN